MAPTLARERKPDDYREYRYKALGVQLTRIKSKSAAYAFLSALHIQHQAIAFGGGRWLLSLTVAQGNDRLESTRYCGRTHYPERKLPARGAALWTTLPSAVQRAQQLRAYGEAPGLDIIDIFILEAGKEPQ